MDELNVNYFYVKFIEDKNPNLLRLLYYYIYITHSILFITVHFIVYI